MAVLFAGSVVALERGRTLFGPRAAIAVAAALLAIRATPSMFHELSSEPVFAAAFAGWALLVVRAAFGPSAGRFALVGARRRRARPRAAGERRAARLRPLSAPPRRAVAGEAELARRIRPRCGPPTAGVDRHNGVRFDY